MVSVGVVMGGFWGEHLLGVVPPQVNEAAILHIATQDSFLGQGRGILEGIVSPAVHSAEEQGSVGFRCHVFVKVELEQLLGSFLLHNSHFIVTNQLVSINY